MKLDRNFLIPLILSLIFCLLAVTLANMPLSIMIGILLFIVIPILLIQNKTDNDWGIMFLSGIPIALIFIILTIIIAVLANNFQWIKDILLWPYK